MKFIVTFLLIGFVIAYVLWLRPVDTPVVSPDSDTISTSTPTTPATTTAATTSTDSVDTATTTADVRVIEGVFLSLQEMEAEWRTGYTYLLLDDGTEIFRIDLRPLLGDTTRDVAEKLGVVRGERVEVTGTVNAEGAFRVQSIEPVSPTRTVE